MLVNLNVDQSVVDRISDNAMRIEKVLSAIQDVENGTAPTSSVVEAIKTEFGGDDAVPNKQD